MTRQIGIAAICVVLGLVCRVVAYAPLGEVSAIMEPSAPSTDAVASGSSIFKNGEEVPAPMVDGVTPAEGGADSGSTDEPSAAVAARLAPAEPKDSPETIEPIAIPKGQPGVDYSKIRYELRPVRRAAPAEEKTGAKEKPAKRVAGKKGPSKQVVRRPGYDENGRPLPGIEARRLREQHQFQPLNTSKKK